LVLLDEADKFLNSDAAQGFTVVKNLKRLMDDTQRRFKVVFAGLHNVQQYQNIPNQPLAHLQPLVVGPLEPRAARELVEVPMTALGFRFADEQSIPRILAYTNYHPGLIQLFCHELVEALLGRPATSLSDLEIRQGDVEAVYRRAEVQLAIRDRFDWTLALDARYQLLALSLVYDQMAEHDGYSRAYGLAEVLALGRYWWPQGFDRVETDQLQGILDDMCGLGVLVRNSSDHRYRLRSPNLVRLMGSAGDIELALLTLSEKPAAIEGVKGDSHHTLLDDPTLIYSPFTYAQARKLKAKQFGVGLVFGSDALGLRHVKEASRQFVAPDSPTDKTGAWEEMRSVAISAETTRQGLQRFWSRHQDCSRLIAYRAMRGSGEQLLEQVTAVIDFCAKHARSQRQWLRVLLAFDPSATWEWVHLAADLRVELEQKADAVVWLHRWDEDGLKQLLEQHGKRATSKGLQRLLSETGGWPIVLHRLATTWSKDQDDPTEGLESLQSNLYGPDGELRQEVLGALGLSEDPIIKQALHDISRCAEPIEPGDLPIIMEGERAPSEAECVRLCEYLVGLGILQQSDAGLSVEPLVSRLLSANHVS
jgi:hypothetical protein